MTNQDPRPSFTQGAFIVLLAVLGCIAAAPLLVWSIQ